MALGNKFKELFKNTGLLFIGNFSSKVLVFFLVPLYTSVLSTEEYGTYNILYTTALVLVPILTLNVLDGVMRFSLNESVQTQGTVFTVSLKYILISLGIIFLGTFFASRVLNIAVIKGYELCFIGLFVSYVVQQLTVQFARGLDDILGISIGGIIGTAVMIGLNIYFLLFAKLGLRGYFYANIGAMLIPTVFLLVRDRMNHYYVGFRKLCAARPFEREMLAYCLPLIFTTLSWYINNLADQYAVTFFCGLEANGVYSVAYKIPAILNAVQAIFIQSWQLSAIREYGTEEGNDFIRKVYFACQSLMVLMCSGIIFTTKFLAGILFQKDFFSAWQFVPTLLLHIVFNALSGTVGVVFSAVKDTRVFAVTAVIGAATNIVLNFALTYLMGAEGAAIATVISSIVIWALRMFHARKYIDLRMNVARDALLFALLFAQAAVMTLVSGPAAYGIQLVLVAALAFMCVKNVIPMLKRGKRFDRAAG